MAYDRRAQHGPEEFHQPRGPGQGVPGPGGAERRRGRGGPDALLVGTLALMVGVTALTWTGTGLAGVLRHGAWPEGVTFVRTAHAIRSLLMAPADVPAAWPEASPAALPSATMLWLVFLTQLVLLFSTVLVIMIRVARWRARREARDARAAERRAAPPPPEVPDLRDLPGPVEAVPTPLAVPLAVPVPVPEPPQVEPEPVPDVVAAVLAAPGGAIVLDPDGALRSRTARRRGRQGPVHVYDPEHATDAPVRLRWAPQRGCEEMPVARSRAAALLAPVRPREPVFRLDAEAAETLLRCYLHAAALSGQPLTQVHRWAQGRSANEPAKVLRAHSRAAGGASMELESTLTGHPVRRDAALVLIGKALAGLDQLHIRQSCSPGRVDALALDNLAGEDGTLYVVGDQRETAGLRGALVDALVTARPALTVVGADLIP
ncbi:hypothetical protein [Streptomyces sp. SBT349]|uniref:hypothetical protein n=1 Tax=Streptomyces sp. SBT349 TaxID=1580539 RepID=UPI00066EB184|nr:hypothetical protein [Streptomyces sp. SBT349]